VNKSLMRKPETTKNIKFDGQIILQAAQTPVKVEELGASRRLSLANAKIQQMKTYQSQSSN
jgi:hypothetical protein